MRRTARVAFMALACAAGAASLAPRALAANAAPTVTTFTTVTGSLSPIGVLSYSATDTDGTVAGYLITDTSTKPAATAAGWTAAPPASYATTRTGSVTLYAWAKDNLGAVSAAKTSVVTVGSANADTLDGLHAAAFAPASHMHSTDTIVDGSITAAKLAAGTIQVQTLGTYAGVRIVHKGAVDNITTFSTLTQALNSITDASATNRYVVMVMPGTYSNEVAYMKSYVDLRGASRNSTVLQNVQWYSGTSGPGIVGSTLSNLTVRTLGVSYFVDTIAVAEDVDIRPDTAPWAGQGAVKVSGDATLEMRRCRIVLTEGGNAVAMAPATGYPVVRIEDCEIDVSGENVTHGIGIWRDTHAPGQLTVRRSTIRVSVGTPYGQAIGVAVPTEAEVEGSTIEVTNLVTNWATGIVATSNLPTFLKVFDSRIKSSYYGVLGGYYAASQSGKTTLSNCTVEAQGPAIGGGGYLTNAEIRNSSVSGNPTFAGDGSTTLLKAGASMLAGGTPALPGKLVRCYDDAYNQIPDR